MKPNYETLCHLELMQLIKNNGYIWIDVEINSIQEYDTLNDIIKKIIDIELESFFYEKANYYLNNGCDCVYISFCSDGRIVIIHDYDSTDKIISLNTFINQYYNKIEKIFKQCRRIDI